LSFNGAFVIAPPVKAVVRQEYGPFEIDAALKRIMHSSTLHFEPHQGDHVRSSELCATCHTLYTHALDERGAETGTLPEQMPYQEWLHSNFARTRSCQSCHMPVVTEPVQVSRVLGEPRTGVARHTFVAANFFMQRMLNAHRDELSVEAPAGELAAATARTRDYLRSSAATLEITNVASGRGKLEIALHVRNLGGHKLPTAFPSRSRVAAYSRHRRG